MTASVAAVPTPVTPSERFLGAPVLPRPAQAAGLRVGAGFAAFFGTLWLVQGLSAAAGPVVVAAGLLPGAAIAIHLRRTRGQRPHPPTVQSFLAERHITRATVAQIAVSVPGGILVHLLVGPAGVLPFVIPTVGLYLLAIAPVLRRRHTAIAGLALTVLPPALAAALTGPPLTATVGTVCGAVFLAKGVVDLIHARGAR